MIDLRKKLSELPPIFGRKAVERLLPGVIAAKTLANLFSSGKGPPVMHLGRLTYYERDSFISWLLASSRSIGFEE